MLGNKKYSRFVPLRQESQIFMVILEDKDQKLNERFSKEMSEESRRENWMCRHLTFYHCMIFSSLFQKVKFRSFIDPDFVFPRT